MVFMPNKSKHTSMTLLVVTMSVTLESCSGEPITFTWLYKSPILTLIS